jgi:Domain of unknown function (DUF4760)
MPFAKRLTRRAQVSFDQFAGYQSSATSQGIIDNQDMPPSPNPTILANLASDLTTEVAHHDSSPNWADQLTAFSSLALVVTAVIAGIVTLVGLRQARGVQHAQTFSDISQRWNETEFREGRIRIRNLYDAKKEPKDVTSGLVKLKRTNERQYWESLMTLDFFEIVAMNIKYNSVTFDMVYDLMGSAICRYWTMLSDHIEVESETAFDKEKFYCEFKGLAEKINKRNECVKSQAEAGS